MRYLYGSPEALFEDLEREHKKKSPFVVVLSSVDRCEVFRRIARERFGKDSAESGVFHHDDIEWHVTHMGRSRFPDGSSCAIEDGASDYGDPGRSMLPPCVALMHVYWTPGAAPAKIDTLSDRFSRGARTCTFYGSLAFFVLFFIAFSYELWRR